MKGFPMPKSKLMFPAIAVVGIVGYVAVAGLTGFCPSCQLVTNSVFGSATSTTLTTALPGGEAVQETQAQPEEAKPVETKPEFATVRRPGSVDIEETYNLDNLAIPRDEIHTLLPKDAIPALTDPETLAIADADFLNESSRIVVVQVGDEVLGVPLAVLNFHEIVNTTLGGVPIAATYCPLCDSATVFKRTVGEGDDAVVLEFGVSGALYNSNVIMYDRTDQGLWSQLALQAVSGPRVGTQLEFLPIQIITLTEFTSRHPDAPVVSNDTGHERDYSQSPYTAFFEDPERILVPVMGIGDKLPKKTLGLGILAGEDSYFVSADAIGQGMTIQTSAGPVVAQSTEAGIEVSKAPGGVRTAQAFYYSWSAFHPTTEVIAE